MPVSSKPKSQLAWYVVETHESGGDKAQLALAIAGASLWRPFDVRRDPTRGKGGKPRRDIRTPRFGRYFFIHVDMSDTLLDAVRNTTGVADVLCAHGSGTPIAVPDEQIEWLKTHCDDGKACENMPVIKDHVRVKEGPFAGFEGPVMAVDKRGVLKVDILLFGRLSPIIVESGHVDIVKLAKSRAISTNAKRVAA